MEKVKRTKPKQNGTGKPRKYQDHGLISINHVCVSGCLMP